MEPGWTFALSALRVAAGALLFVAGAAKLRAGPTLFQRAILGYDLVAEPVARWLARALPWLEILVGGALATGFLTVWASVAAFALVLAFSAAILASLVRGRKHHCGCVGFTWAQVQEVQWRLVYRNLALLAVFVASSAVGGGAFAIDRWIGAEHHRSGVVASALAVVWGVSLIVTAAAHLRSRYPLRPLGQATSRVEA